MSKMTKTITLSESEIRTLIQSAVRARLLKEAAPALGKEQSTAGLDEGTVAALTEIVEAMNGPTPVEVVDVRYKQDLSFAQIGSDAGDFAGSYRLINSAILPRRESGGYPINSIYDVTTSLILKGLNQEDVRGALQGPTTEDVTRPFSMRVEPDSDYANAGISGLRLVRDKDVIFSIYPIYSAWHVAKLIVMGSDVKLNEKSLAEFPEIVAAIQKIVPAKEEDAKK